MSAFHIYIQVTMADFEKALGEVKPAFGTSAEMLDSYMTHGIIPCGETFWQLQQTLCRLAQQVRNGDKTPLLTVILEGPFGSGKSALATSAAKQSEFPFCKVVSCNTMAGYSEQVNSSWSRLGVVVRGGGF